MPKIFVDANIYLLFFDNNAQKLREFTIPSLLSVADHIYLTKQVVDEVSRRKLGAFVDALNSSQRGKGVTISPPPLFGASDESLKKIEERKKKVNAEIDKIHADLDAKFVEIARSISQSTDEVSKQLESILARAKAPSDPAVAKARLRRQLGNPPGKGNDPLGDQITWEQLLEDARPGDKIWIVTRDPDYHSKVDQTCLLNAFLFKELQAKIGPRGQVFCFDNPVEALKHFHAETKIAVKVAPADEEPKIQAEIERAALVTTALARSAIATFGQNPWDMFVNPVLNPNIAAPAAATWMMTCPRCKQTAPPKVKSHGGIKEILCPNCSYPIL